MRRLLGIAAVGCAAVACAHQASRFEGPAGAGGEEASLPVGTPPTREGHRADAVVDAHRQALLAVPGVVGIGLGRTPAGSDAILIWVTEAHVGDRLPAEIDGHTVIVKVVPGGFRAY